METYEGCLAATQSHKECLCIQILSGVLRLFVIGDFEISVSQQAVLPFNYYRVRFCQVLRNW